MLSGMKQTDSGFKDASNVITEPYRAYMLQVNKPTYRPTKDLVFTAFNILSGSFENPLEIQHPIGCFFLAPAEGIVPP